MEFDVGRPAFMPPFSTTREGSELTVRGRINMYCEPSIPGAFASRVGDVLILTVELEASGDLEAADCESVQRTVNYDVVITGFTRLTNFRIVHSWPGTGHGDAVVYESVWD